MKFKKILISVLVIIITSVLISTASAEYVIDKDNLAFAVKKNNVELARKMINGGISVDSKYGEGWTPLMLAAGNGSYEVAKFLIDEGAAIDDTDNEDWTPLMFAVSYNNPKITKLLLDEGAAIFISFFGSRATEVGDDNPEIINVFKDYSLELVKNKIDNQKEDPNMIMKISYILKDFNLNPGEIKDEENKNLLMLAIEANNIALAKSLIIDEKLFNKINSKDKYGKTALMYAVENNYVELTEIILEEEKDYIDVNKKNNENKTALDIAEENNYSKIINLLKENGAGNLRTSLTSAIKNDELNRVKKLVPEK